MPPAPAPVLQTPTMLTAFLGNLVVSCWRESVQLRDVVAIVEASDELLERYPGGFGTMNLIEEGTLAPDDARVAGSQRIRDLGPKLLCTTNVLLGRGLWVAGARALSATVNLLAGRPVTARLTSTIEDASQWQADLLGDPDGTPVRANDVTTFAANLLASFRAD